MPKGWPSTFAIGLAVRPGSDFNWVSASGVPWAMCYQYISSGVLARQSWVTTWGKNFAKRYAAAAHRLGCIPVFTYYQIVPTVGHDGASSDYKALNNGQLMAEYYTDFTALLKQSAAAGVGPVVIHVEPDLWGYLEATGRSPEQLTASVASSGNADVSAYPNTVAGFGQALLHLRTLYCPSCIMAAHVSEWLWTSSTDPWLNVTEIAKHDAAFMTATGNWDMFLTDIADRDAGYYQMVKRDRGGHWWDATNQRYPNFHRLFIWAAAFTNAAGKRLAIWQVPEGNQIFRACDNTRYHYQDNRAQYWLRDYPTNTAIKRLAEAGVIGILFGAGGEGATDVYNASGQAPYNPAPISTYQCNDCNTRVSNLPDDDGGFLRLSVGEYYRSGALPLPLGPVAPSG